MCYKDIVAVRLKKQIKTAADIACEMNGKGDTPQRSVALGLSKNEIVVTQMENSQTQATVHRALDLSLSKCYNTLL